MGIFGRWTRWPNRNTQTQTPFSGFISSSSLNQRSLSIHHRHHHNGWMDAIMSNPFILFPINYYFRIFNSTPKLSWLGSTLIFAKFGLCSKNPLFIRLKPSTQGTKWRVRISYPCQLSLFHVSLLRWLSLFWSNIGIAIRHWPGTMFQPSLWTSP